MLGHYFQVQCAWSAG